jgi:hypothetical protein
MKLAVILIVLVLVIAAASIVDCVGFGPGIYGVC